jgi:hypothetical protein
LDAFHIKVLGETLDFGIANVGLVDIGHEVEKDEHRNEMPLYGSFVSQPKPEKLNTARQD